MTLLLNLAQKTISKGNFPGRYVLAEYVSWLLGPANDVVDGRIGEYTVSFDFKDQLQRQMYFGLYDPPETQLLYRLLQPGDIFLDVGANVGYYTLVASQIVGPDGQVHAFEPIAQNTAALRETITQNNISNILVNEVAVGATPGSLQLYVGDREIGNSGWASIVSSQKRTKGLTVEKISLDRYLQAREITQVQLVKLDIEGSELQALQGMESLLSGPDAPSLLCEVNPYLLGKLNLSPRVLTTYLDERGYLLFEVDRSAIRPIAPEHEITRLVNLFCTKRRPSWRTFA